MQPRCQRGHCNYKRLNNYSVSKDFFYFNDFIYLETLKDEGDLGKKMILKSIKTFEIIKLCEYWDVWDVEVFEIFFRLGILGIMAYT